MHENEIASIVVDTCFKIHSEIGPGLFESVYEEILYYELKETGLLVDKQKPIPVFWKELRMDVGFRADLIVENKVIVEIKSIEAIASVHKKQLLTYLKITGLKLGLLINFNEALIKNGITRIVNKLQINSVFAPLREKIRRKYEKNKLFDLCFNIYHRFIRTDYY